MTEGQKRKGSYRGHGASKKQKYTAGTKGSGHAVPMGARGLLITVDQGRERKASTEMLAVVEEHYAKLEPQESVEDAPAKATAPTDIGAAIAAEVAELKDKSKHKFRYHDTLVQGTIFILFPDEPAEPSPQAVALSICREAQDRQQLRSRYVSRVLPVTHTCFADLDSIKKMAQQLVEAAGCFTAESKPLQFGVEYEHRSSGKLDRMSVINAFVDNVATPPHKVNLSKPQKSILVNVTRNMCTAAVVDSYRDLGKYNLKKLAGVLEEEGGGKQQGDKAADGKDAAAKVDKSNEQGQDEGETAVAKDADAAAEEGQQEVAAGAAADDVEAPAS